MKARPQNETRHDRTTTDFKQLCLNACREIVAQVEQARSALLAEFHPKLGSREHLLRLAVNEAEALAWQTDYPHLVFPTLATEKIQAVANWDAHQRAVRQYQPPYRLAA